MDINLFSNVPIYTILSLPRLQHKIIDVASICVLLCYHVQIADTVETYALISEETSSSLHLYVLLRWVMAFFSVYGYVQTSSGGKGLHLHGAQVLWAQVPVKFGRKERVINSSCVAPYTVVVFGL